MWSFDLIRIMMLPLLQLFLMCNNVHCLRKVKLGGKDCTFKVRSHKCSNLKKRSGETIIREVKKRECY